MLSEVSVVWAGYGGNGIRSNKSLYTYMYIYMCLYV